MIQVFLGFVLRRLKLVLQHRQIVGMNHLCPIVERRLGSFLWITKHLPRAGRGIKACTHHIQIPPTIMAALQYTLQPYLAAAQLNGHVTSQRKCLLLALSQCSGEEKQQHTNDAAKQQEKILSLIEALEKTWLGVEGQSPSLTKQLQRCVT